VRLCVTALEFGAEVEKHEMGRSFLPVPFNKVKDSDHDHHSNLPHTPHQLPDLILEFVNVKLEIQTKQGSRSSVQ